MPLHSPKAICIKNSGFTLMELIIVIIIMGVMSLGIAGFIKLSTQTYLNVTERDELLANARFSVERLNREVRNALPSSMREFSNTTTRCLEFVPIVASTVYTDIAVAPNLPTNSLTVVPFNLRHNEAYICDSLSVEGCEDIVIVYPLSKAEIYKNHSGNAGKAFYIKKYTQSTILNTLATIELENNSLFAEYSPTSRAYIFNTPVSYCLNGDQLKRHVGYGFNAVQPLPPSSGSSSLMAQNVDFASSSFTVLEASLRRNAVVQIKLNFTRDGEEVVFDNAIHIKNIP